MTTDLPVLEGIIGPLPGNSAGWLIGLASGRFVVSSKTAVPFRYTRRVLLQLTSKRQKLQTGAITLLKCVDGLMATVLTSRRMQMCLL